MVEDEAMVVVGIDPGIARTGYGFVRLADQGNLETIAYGVIETPAGQSVEQRLQTLFQRLRKLMLLHNPSTGAVGGLFFQLVAAVLRLDEIPEPDDAADALAVAVYCINSNGIDRLERLQ